MEPVRSDAERRGSGNGLAGVFYLVALRVYVNAWRLDRAFGAEWGSEPLPGIRVTEY
jgi:hypothetical protein